jgi:integrase
MSRPLNLSDTLIRNIKPGYPRARLTDGSGLYLLTFVKGGAHGWRLDYTFGGKRKTISLGTYPDTGLRLARDKAATARQLIASGTDPSQQRKSEKLQQAIAREAELHQAEGKPVAGTFEQVAREWFATRRGEWAPGYADKILQRLERDIFPFLGRSSMDAITPPKLLEVLRRIEARGAIETAHRALENCGQAFRFGVATGRATSDPGRDLKDALRKPQVEHFPAVTDPKRLGQVLRAMAGYNGTPVVKAALRLTPMLLLRPGELRQAEWSEIDLDAALLPVAPARMKGRRHAKVHGKAHFVALPRQAVEVLRELHQVTGQGELVFRGERDHDRPMSDAAVNAALRAMGFAQDELTAHGFRATARTMLAERLGVHEAVIEAQLAHAVKSALGRAYDRTQFLVERKVMMQQWADYLDEIQADDNDQSVQER